MWLAPAFHHGPRWLPAERHAWVSLSPRFIKLRARAEARFHCRHRMQRSLRRSHPSASSSALLVSVSLKYAAQPRSNGLSLWIVAATLRPRAPRKSSRTFSASLCKLCLAIRSFGALCQVML
jgi:hypothetical protein